jgi:hypothetical protein
MVVGYGEPIRLHVSIEHDNANTAVRDNISNTADDNQANNWSVLLLKEV